MEVVDKLICQYSVSYSYIFLLKFFFYWKCVHAYGKAVHSICMPIPLYKVNTD